jgi:hypothetical protein
MSDDDVAAHAASTYLRSMVTGDVAPLRKLLAHDVVVHDPRVGRVEGDAVRPFLEQTQRWLRDRDAQLETVSSTSASGRAVEESIVRFRKLELPIAIVAEAGPSGVGSLRVYHSNFPITGGHFERKPILHENPELTLPDVAAAYQGALAEGDVDRMLSLYDDAGTAREPSAYLYEGKDELRIYYGALFGNEGGIQVERCTVIDDGRACAFEYNVVRWGKTKLAPQAGLSVYQRGPTGKLVAVRIYHDVDPPLS